MINHFILKPLMSLYYPEWNFTNLLFVTAIILICCVFIYREMHVATQLKYSKFSVVLSLEEKNKMISSFYGMFLMYSPSMLISFGFFLVSSSKRQYLTSLLLFLHYSKRVLEVLFLHRYSGKSKLLDNLLISTTYATFSVVCSAYANQVADLSATVAVVAVSLFLLGECVNFYHHYLLSQLRQGGSKEYKIPSKGFFEYTWCPHYTGEIISFLAIALSTQHFFAFVLQIASCSYLMVRAYKTREWYKQKFTDVPDRACLFPFLF